MSAGGRRQEPVAALSLDAQRDVGLSLPRFAERYGPQDALDLLDAMCAASVRDRRIRGLGYFEDVSFQPKPTPDPYQLDLDVGVVERPTGSFSFGAGSGSASFNVVQQSLPIVCGGPLQDACVWSAVSSVPWITIVTSMPRVGDDPVTFTVAPNPTTMPRIGQITVRDQVIVVMQAGS